MYRMRLGRLKAIAALCAISMAIHAQDGTPTINPTGTMVSSGGEQQGSSYSAPLTVRFEAGTENAEGWSAYYEWRFTREGEDKPYLIRYDEDTEYTFTQAGSHRVVLYATFSQPGQEDVVYGEEYWEEKEPLSFAISTSILEMPNAFSPNNDSRNDTYCPKKCQSIVDFHAYIFNRWGQKLYEWTDPTAPGWDGTFHGKPVKEGVYFVLVKAKGADGRTFNIKKDVNLMRGYTETGRSE